VIDDGLTYARVVAKNLPEYELIAAGQPAEAPRLEDGPTALAFLERHGGGVDVVLLDMKFDVEQDRLLPLDEGADLRRTRRFQGIAILREIRKRHAHLPVVLLTSQSDLSLADLGEDLANQSMTYFLDGDDLDSLRIRINAAVQEASQPAEEEGILWGHSPTMRAVRRRLSVLAQGRMPVILEGETGTGKSYLAERFLHARSNRPGPFVTVDLGTVPPDLVAAHLFGATRGAYTGAVADRKGVFELADQGTLFLDEVQNIPLDVQKQLLLVLQDRRVRPLGSSREIDVDVKVVAASSMPLARTVAEGRFRRDLYMRLSPATRVVIPPLRERLDDLPFLARRLTEKAGAQDEAVPLRDRIASAAGLQSGLPMALLIDSEPPPGTSNEPGVVLALPGPSWRLLAEHSWPGNVRELAMVLHNLVTFTLIEATEALRSGLSLKSARLQVDPGLIASLLTGYSGVPDGPSDSRMEGGADNPLRFEVTLEAGETLNDVSNTAERQYFLSLFRRTKGDFRRMAELLLGDADRERAVRLRFNQLGLKVRELRGAER
jgi:DNA-binding NtrC family response regulator